MAIATEQNRFMATLGYYGSEIPIKLLD